VPSLIQRLGTTVDVASALEYLHHNKQVSIVHSDEKPSKILLENHSCSCGRFWNYKMYKSITIMAHRAYQVAGKRKGGTVYTAPSHIGVEIK
jgi:serine/threonine protein kinase